MDSEQTLDKALRISENLCESKTVNVAPIEGGRNSRIFRVETSDNVYALKFFRPDKNGKMERFEAETTALRIFKENGIAVTPKIMAEDRNNNCSLMEWIEGDQVLEYGAVEIKALASFVKNVHKISTNEKYRKVRYATETCLNGDEIVMQVKNRLKRLESSKNQYPELRELLDNNLMPAFDEITEWSRSAYFQMGMDFSDNISFEKQTLSLVDIGFHNTLRKNGTLYFFDFEFFGWDDPAHLISDTLWHPGMSLRTENRKVFCSNVVDVFSNDDQFFTRLHAQFPLYGFRWCMIMLNVFLRDYKSFKKDDSITKTNQIKKVKLLLDRIKNHQSELKDITS